MISNPRSGVRDPCKLPCILTAKAAKAFPTLVYPKSARRAKISEVAQWTLIEAVENGWWHSVPLPAAGMVFAYMTDSDLWMDRQWDELLQLAPLTFERAGRSPVPPPSQIISAASVVRRPVTGADWMAIGDAAFAFDPLSGQGVFKSIDTGIRCGSVIARHLDGDLSAIAEYETWVNESYQSYLSTRTQFYSSVVRWPESQFWKRRASARGV